MNVLAEQGLEPEIVRVHCLAKSTLIFFEQKAAEMAARLPKGCTIEFLRWREKSGGEKIHNRYVLTDLGGVALGVGLDAGDEGETDDLLLLPRAQYERRWSQYVGSTGAFECADTPANVEGSKELRPRRSGS